MDRFEAMTTFVAVVDNHGFAAAARRTGHSPATVTRAVAWLEKHFNVRLLTRTTRSVKLTEAGSRLVDGCRRILAELGEADLLMSGERSNPRGTLVVTAPVQFGTLKVLPHLDRFLSTYPDVSARLVLLDRVVNMVDEGIDVAIRLGHLPESNLIALPVGQVRRVVCASPTYLSRNAAIRRPADLQQHECISFTQVTPNDHWAFAQGPGARASTQVRVKPRLVVNTAAAAIAAALAGRGVTRVLSYQVEQHLAAETLQLILEPFEQAPMPVHIVFPESRLAAAKTRAFVDMVVPALREELKLAVASLPRPQKTKSRKPTKARGAARSWAGKRK